MVKIANKQNQQGKTTKNQEKPRTRRGRVRKVNGTNRSNIKKQATKILKNQEKEKTKIQLTVDGDVSYVAGSYLILDKTWGKKFSGKYIIDKVDHSLGTEYNCQIEAYKIEELEEEKK